MNKTLLTIVFLSILKIQALAENIDFQQPNIQIISAFPNLTFELPVDLKTSNDGTNRLFVVEQKGRIKVFNNDPLTETSNMFLDMTDVVFSGHSEEGLLGLAFHPDFEKNGFFYVYHTMNKPRRNVLARYTVSPRDINAADKFTRQVILEIEKPYGNHNGGCLQFGPDGYLYISVGDGGSGGDPHNNGQKINSWLGKILRIDVNNAVNGKTYSPPQDNPFAENHGGRASEIFAYGLRNTWRFSFDSLTGQLWAGDVGQDKPLEEVDIIEKGRNYGWNIMEGFDCYNPPEKCNKKGLTLPIWQYSSDQGRSITGGYVYRGESIPELYGKYIFGDFISGNIWALTHTKESTSALLLHSNRGTNISTFGLDENNEIYFCAFDGKVYKIASRN